MRVIEELEKEGAFVSFFDSYIPEYKEHGKVKKGELKLTEELIKNSDLVIITAAHTNVDYEFVRENAKFIFDTKNVTKTLENKDKIELL